MNQRQGNEDSAKPGMSESILMSRIGTKVTLLSQGRKKERSSAKTKPDRKDSSTSTE